MTLRAVVTAGGRVDAIFAAEIGTPVKALAPFAGTTLVDVMVSAIREAGVSDIAVVGDAAVARHLSGSGVRMLAAVADGAANVRRALDAWPAGDLLFAASDLPFVDGQALRAFLSKARLRELAMPVADGAAYESAYPGAAPHVTRVGNVRVANGSVFYIGAAARVPVRAVAGRAFDSRKSLIALARLLGPAVVFGFLTRSLSIADVERRASHVLGIHAGAVRGCAPGLCYDVDTLADYRYACAHR